MNETADQVSTCNVGCSAPFLMGSVLSAAISWKLNASLFWAVFHFCTSWLYIIWCFVARTQELAALGKQFWETFK